MVKLEGRQWGLVTVVAGSPFCFAFMLAAASPQLVAPVLGTAVGAASWLLAALLGLLGGALFAGCLSALTRHSTSRLGLGLGMTFAALVPVSLCIVPALCLLLAGPALAVRLERVQVGPAQELAHSPHGLAQRLRQQLPRVLPSMPRLSHW